jgi:endonuclease G
MIKTPRSIAQAAKRRVRGKKAVVQRNRVRKEIKSGTPLRAEQEDRVLSRIQAVTGVNRLQAKTLVEQQDPALLGLVGEARLGAERIQGTTTDFVSVSFLELAQAAAGTVGRVIFRNGQPVGSGFMITKRLFLTNNHVIKNKNEAAKLLVEFNYELDINKRPKPVTRFELAPEKFLVTSTEDRLDFTVIAIGERIRGTGELFDFGYCPLLDTQDKHALSEVVNVIQHPEGDFKQVVLRENRIVSRLDTVLHYEADTSPGSSGSPVFNDQWEAIALHHWGEPYTETETYDGQPVKKDVNEGIRISAIVNALKKEGSRLSRNRTVLLDEILHSRFRHPSNVREQMIPSRPIIRPRPDISKQQFKREQENVITVQLPLKISVSVGDERGNLLGEQQRVLANASQNDFGFFREAITVDRDYSKRQGYKPDFLPGHHIGLPVLNGTQMAQAAQILNSAADENPYELKYQHFSIIVNRLRRMAFFTAVNINGATWIHIVRKTGRPREAEARERWFNDPRIDQEAQCEQSLYDGQQPRRVFDRGHLVRRQDPAWGSPDRAQIANADTFHFTNCTPMESIFNQQSKHWQGIENYVLDNAKAENERVSVFTGPIFKVDDPDYRSIKIPQRFWKIIVRVENDELLATALMADQSERIPRVPELLEEGFDDLSGVKEYQISIPEIERLTGLNFGTLRDFDTFQPGPERMRESIRPIKDFDDVHLDSTKRHSKRK